MIRTDTTLDQDRRTEGNCVCMYAVQCRITVDNKCEFQQIEKTKKRKTSKRKKVFKDLNSFHQFAVLFCAQLPWPTAVHHFWSHCLSCVTRAFSASTQNFSLPVRSSYHTVSSRMLLSPFSQFCCQVFRSCTFSLDLDVFAASSTSQASKLADSGTPSRSMPCFLYVLVHKGSLFLWMRLELFAVFPFLHQAVKTAGLHTLLLFPAGALLLLSVP